jgi:osmoprotectant transport system ATP-binding protein
MDISAPETPNNIILHLDNISISYGNKVVLDQCNLSIFEKSVTVLLGSSGCGKSTILRLLLGLIQPDSGNVYLGGEELTSDNISRIRQKVGYVIQDGGLFPHLTARQNITLLVDHLDIEQTVQNKRIDALLDLTTLSKDVLDRFPSELSGGQKQRIALIRSLMNDPDILLLDEPLGALDSLIRSKLQVDLKRIFRELNKTVLLVTHDLSEAEWFSEDLVLMNEGQIVQRGSTSELIGKPANEFVSLFINAQKQSQWMRGGNNDN